MNTLDQFSLRDRVVLLTGGAGLYGRGVTTALAEAGARLVIAARNLDRLKTVAAEETAHGHEVIAEQYDQGDEASIRALHDRILERCGRVDGLVNNSVQRPMRDPGHVADWEESMRVNATGLFHMHRLFGDTMAAAGRGSIVNIGSIHGMGGPSFELYEGTDMPTTAPDYFFHKGGLLNLTRWYAARLGPSGVRVNAISPGGYFNHQPEPFVGRYNTRTMLGRMANDTDLGGAVIFLLSAAAAYITAANLPLDGGYTAK